MKFKKFLVLVLAAVLVFGVSTAFSEKNIVVKGSTTVLPIAQKAVEVYVKKYPGVNISLSGGGSGDGIKALIDGITHIANSSRELKPEEEAKAKAKNVNPVAHIIAYDAVVPIVHPSNKVKSLTLDQLSQIYQGNIRNWQEVGGDNLPIVVVSRDSSSGTFETWGHIVMKGARVTPRALMQASNGAVIQAVAKNKYAIGYVGMGYLNQMVKPLAVDGISASVETVRAKKYPVSRPLYMYTNGKPKDEVASFIDFILSKEGQKLVKELGFVPVK